MYSPEYSEGQGRLLSGPQGFFVLVDEPHTTIWNVESQILAEMASSLQVTVEELCQSLRDVLSWARYIMVRVFFTDEAILGIRVEEILLDAIVTRVEPYCSELRGAEGRVLKVVQRLFDGNTPQLDTRYIIGIPWSRRDIKRHWASSVHKRVKKRRSELPGEIVKVEFVPLVVLPDRERDVREIAENPTKSATADDEPTSSSSLDPVSKTDDERNVPGGSDPTTILCLESRPISSSNLVRSDSVEAPSKDSWDSTASYEESYDSGEADSQRLEEDPFVSKSRPVSRIAISTCNSL